jgi:3-phenylpropionate/trans-cinnamate dioxygenase ferredoxin subunit
LYALDNTCTHAVASLANGRVVGGCVECPLHSTRFDLRTGRSKTPSVPDTRTYRLRVRQGQVFLLAEDPPYEAGL